MKKEEALKQKEKLKKEMNTLYPDILKELLRKEKYLGEDYLRRINERLIDDANQYTIDDCENEFYFACLYYETELEDELEELSEEEIEAYFVNRREEFNKETSKVQAMCSAYQRMKYKLAFGIDRKTDMEMEFDGSIIITDPCYIIRKKTDDWNKCNYGSDMSVLGLTQYMTRDTLYGDWSCTTFNQDTGEEIGSFCADAGLVGVYLLDEVMAYNPDYKDVEENHWCVTCIRDFKGTVEFRVVHKEGIYETTSSYHKAGDKWEHDEVEVHGHGINKVTGESINFVAKQTGL